MDLGKQIMLHITIKQLTYNKLITMLHVAKLVNPVYIFIHDQLVLLQQVKLIGSLSNRPHNEEIINCEVKVKVLVKEIEEFGTQYSS